MNAAIRAAAALQRSLAESGLVHECPCVCGDTTVHRSAGWTTDLEDGSVHTFLYCVEAPPQPLRLAPEPGEATP